MRKYAGERPEDEKDIQLGDKYIINLGGSEWRDTPRGRRLYFLLYSGGIPICWIETSRIKHFELFEKGYREGHDGTIRG